MQDTGDLPQYTNVQMPWPHQPPHVPDDNPTGIYERSFEVPSTWERVVLHVGAAESVLVVEVNGALVGLSKDSHLAAEFDVTSFVRPGENTLRLRVVKWSDASFIEDQDQWWHGGITRSVFLYGTPRTYLADVRLDAGLADDSHDRARCARRSTSRSRTSRARMVGVGLGPRAGARARWSRAARR